MKATNRRKSNAKAEAANDETEENELEDEEALLSRNNKQFQPDAWTQGGEKKAHIMGLLIENFGSLVEWQHREDAVPDYRGHFKDEDKIYSKLFTASISVYKAQKYKFEKLFHSSLLLLFFSF